MQQIHEFIVFAHEVFTILVQVLVIIILLITTIRVLQSYIRRLLNSGHQERLLKEEILEFGHSFSLAFGLTIGLSLISLLLNPGWHILGQLAVLAALRTGLNQVLVVRLSQLQHVKGGRGRSRSRNRNDDKNIPEKKRQPMVNKNDPLSGRPDWRGRKP
jgi:uncharacterized membrane protein